jgi:hypothetical protein
LFAFRLYFAAVPPDHTLDDSEANPGSLELFFGMEGWKGINIFSE